MSFFEGLRVWSRRVDVRLGCILALLFAPLVAGVLFALYLFAASELLELSTMEIDERLAHLASLWVDPDSTRRSVGFTLLGEQLALDSGGYRVMSADGSILAAEGVAYDPASRGDSSSFLRAARLRSDDRLVGWRSIPSGEQFEVYLSSAGFVRERDEILRGFWVSVGIGIVLVALVAIPATRLALAPLRRATSVMTALDVHRLDVRLPTRGTQDDIDAHSRTINQLLEELEHGFGRLRAFGHDVAHELRTPINRILNATELQLIDLSPDDASRVEFESIRKTAEQMSRLVDGLLLLARGEGDQLASRVERVDVADLCHTLQEIYEPVCEEAGIRLEVTSDGGFVSADASLLLRALGNLLDNALNHTPEKGWIRLRSRIEHTDPRFVAIEVEDSGPGIPEAAREQVFDRFVRLDPAASPNGVGLGLPISRAVVRAYGGEVALCGPEQGGDGSGHAVRGARFIVRIPRV